jgi:cytochrome b6-f complex iron-sulfur subunit
MNRKEFLRLSALAVAGVAVGGSSFLESCSKSSTNPSGPTVDFSLDLTQAANAALNNVGGSVYSQGVIVVKNTATTFVAVAQACTHEGCTVAYNGIASDFVCPCHGGTYSLTGSVISGPPPSPLKSYTVTQSGNILTVKG